MAHLTSTTKSSKGAEHETRTAPAAGPCGIARMPPHYGIEFVDGASDGEGPLQLMPRADQKHGGQAMAPVFSRDRSSSTPNRTGLPDPVKAGIESISGFDMSDVRVHYNSSKPAQLHALAYTQGSDIHVAPGQERHLPHEAWHVVQQKQGRVQPKFQLKGKQINDDQGLEYEADVMGAKALWMRRPVQVATGPSAHATTAEQWKVKPKEASEIPGEASGALGENVRLNVPSTKIHTDAQADTLNRPLGASAFPTGQTLLGHEFTPIVQQTVQQTSHTRVIQRLLYDDINSKLYVPPQWDDQSEKISVCTQSGSKVEEVKCIADYWRPKSPDLLQFMKNLAGHWGVNQATQIVKVAQADHTQCKVEPFFQPLKTASEQRLRSEGSKLFKENTNKKTITAAIQAAVAEQSVPTEGITEQNKEALKALVTSVRQEAAQILDEIITSYIYPLYALYTLTDPSDILDGEKVESSRKAVVNPVSFMEADGGSEIQSGSIDRAKVCVLLAEVYESIYGSQNRGEVLKRLQALASSYKVEWTNKLEWTNFQIPESEFGEHSSVSKKTRDNIYALVQQLHDAVVSTEHGKYDLTKNIETVRKQGGYQLLVSGKFSWQEIPRQLPEGVKMQAGEVYIIGIEGHTQAVKIRQAITGATNITREADYFLPLNETSENYNGNPFTQRVEDIYVRKKPIP